MQNMLKQGADRAIRAYSEVQQESNRLIREDPLMKGRTIVAVMMGHFRTKDKIDMVYTYEHLLRLEYAGYPGLFLFETQWTCTVTRVHQRRRYATCCERVETYHD